MREITPEEYQKWRTRKIEIGRRKLLSVLKAMGVPNPPPMPWEQRWSELRGWEIES